MIRRALNRILRPFGICIGRVIRVEERTADGFIIHPLPPRWRSYRVLPLKRA